MFDDAVLNKAMYSPIMPSVEASDIKTRAHRPNNPIVRVMDARSSANIADIEDLIPLQESHGCPYKFN
ncbi:hypothetical protein RIF29_24957 [Crotalaria pallida]|uniref:Uncharacterized protein n=1 Tax=Crotalaria pallida TaxID=3830 RepID=A0AAN9EKN1_CROPI